MAKNVLLLVSAVVLCVGLWAGYALVRRPVVKTPYIPPPPVERPTPRVFAEVERVNAATSRVRSLVCTQLDVTLEQRLTFNLKGSLYFEKPKGFRLVCGMRTKECDIGSNDDLFWFWSKRMKPSALFYCAHERTLMTRLRTPLHPMWMMECLGFNPVATKDVRVGDSSMGTLVYERRAGMQGSVVTKVTVLDTSRLLVTGHALQDAEGRVIASSRVLEWQVAGGITVPRTVELVWQEESTRIVFRLNSPQVNVRPPAEVWAVPAVQPQIDLAVY